MIHLNQIKSKQMKSDRFQKVQLNLISLYNTLLTKNKILHKLTEDKYSTSVNVFFRDFMDRTTAI